MLCAVVLRLLGYPPRHPDRVGIVCIPSYSLNLYPPPSFVLLVPPPLPFFCLFFSFELTINAIPILQGSAQPGVEHKLTDEGEILMKGPGNMVGYYKAPDKTAEAVTADGFLRTGDRGIIDEQGRLKITGRTKELFKTSKGKYVAPAPIENILNNDAHIEMSLVCGSGQVMTMAVVQLAEGLLAKCEADADLKTTIETDMAALLKHANGEIEHHEKIGFIVIAKEPWTIEDGLLTPTMKIKRTQIEEKYEASMNGWYESSSKTKILFWE